MESKLDRLGEVLILGRWAQPRVLARGAGRHRPGPTEPGCCANSLRCTATRHGTRHGTGPPPKPSKEGGFGEGGGAMRLITQAVIVQPGAAGGGTDAQCTGRDGG